MSDENKIYHDIQMSIRIRCIPDIQGMVNLSYQKRRSYEKAQPNFLAHASEAEKVQVEWFKSLLDREDYVILVADSKEEIVGFIIGQISKAP